MFTAMVDHSFDSRCYGVDQSTRPVPPSSADHTSKGVRHEGLIRYEVDSGAFVVFNGSIWVPLTTFLGIGDLPIEEMRAEIEENRNGIQLNETLVGRLAERVGELGVTFGIQEMQAEINEMNNALQLAFQDAVDRDAILRALNQENADRIAALPEIRAEIRENAFDLSEVESRAVSSEAALINEIARVEDRIVALPIEEIRAQIHANGIVQNLSGLGQVHFAGGAAGNLNVGDRIANTQQTTIGNTAIALYKWDGASTPNQTQSTLIYNRATGQGDLIFDARGSSGVHPSIAFKTGTSANTVERMRITYDSSGNTMVGIGGLSWGTAAGTPHLAPTKTLTVTGTSLVTGNAEFHGQYVALAGKLETDEIQPVTSGGEVVMGRTWFQRGHPTSASLMCGKTGAAGWVLVRESLNGSSVIQLCGHSPGSGHPTGTIICNKLIAGGVGFSSDDRLKHNEQPIVDALTTVRKLKPQIYQKTLTMKAADHSGDVPEDWWWEAGLIAQDVQQIPELAHAVSEGTNTDGNEMPMGLSYNDVFTYSVAALKELDAIVQKQALTIQALTARIVTLENA